MIVLLLTGCASTRVERQVDGQYGAERIPNAGFEIEPLLRSEVSRWDDTPYVLGGASRAGMDCSAFVQRVFRDVFAIDLPRATRGQVKVGRQIGKDELQAGDLVFFRPPAATRHVGIYLSHGEFAHVSSSRGVMISELSSPYWRNAYWTSRRILEDRPIAQTVEKRPEPDKNTAQSRFPAAGKRVGW